MPTEGRSEPDGNGRALSSSKIHRSTCVIKSELHVSEHAAAWRNQSAPCGWPTPPPLNGTLGYRRQDVAPGGAG